MFTPLSVVVPLECASRCHNAVSALSEHTLDEFARQYIDLSSAQLKSDAVDRPHLIFTVSLALERISHWAMDLRDLVEDGSHLAHLNVWFSRVLLLFHRETSEICKMGSL